MMPLKVQCSQRYFFKRDKLHEKGRVEVDFSDLRLHEKTEIRVRCFILIA